jgi:putative ABC transport system substrate-binding protein
MNRGAPGRRTLLRAGLAAALAGVSAPARAEPAPPLRRWTIMMLLPYGWNEACGGFRDYLAQRGIAADLRVRNARGDFSRVPGFVEEINATAPDLVYIASSAMALAALGTYDAPDPLRFIHMSPAVLNQVTDPAAARIVRSLTRPRRHITGVINVAPPLAQLRSIEAYRGFHTLAAIHRRDDPDALIALAQLRRFITAQELVLRTYPVDPMPDGSDPTPVFARALAAARADGAGWLYIPPDAWLETVREQLTAAALEADLPSFAATEPFLTEAEALAGLVCREAATGALAGRLAEQIMTANRPAASLPFSRPERFSLVIRFATARALGAYPPMSLLRYAELR